MKICTQQFLASLALLLLFQTGDSQNKFQKTIFRAQDTVYPLNLYNGLFTRVNSTASIQKNDTEYISISGSASGWGEMGIVSIMDSSGNLKWAKGIIDNYITLNGIALTTGGMIAIGNVYSNIVSATSKVDGYVIGMDSSGDFKWAKAIDAGFNGNEELYNIVPLPDGNFIMLGRVDLSDGSAVPLYVKIDMVGNILWSKHVTNDPILQVYDIITTPDSGFAVSGDYGLLMKFNKQGTMQWNQRLDWGYPAQRYSHLISTSDGGYLLNGSIDSGSYQSRRLLVRKINSLGKEQWTNTYTFSEPAMNGELSPSLPFIAQNGDYILSGRHRTAPFSEKAYLLRMDSLGNINWIKSYGLGCEDYGMPAPGNPGSYVNKLGLGHMNQITRTFETKGKNLLSFGYTGIYVKINPGDEFRGSIRYGSMVLKTDGQGSIACYDQTPVINSSPLIQTYTVPTLITSDISLTSINLTQTTGSLFYSDTIVCGEAKLFHVAFTASDTAICAGQSIDFSSSGSYTAKTINTYKWTFTGGTATDGKDTLANPTGIVYATPGIYQVTLEVSDECDDRFFLVKNAYISVGGTLPVITGDTALCSGERATLMVPGNNGMYLWNTGATSSSLTIAPLDTATYCVTLTDTGGCFTSDCIFVAADNNCDCSVFVPNAFSPNNDGSNELECVLGNCIQTLYFAIYDRWGEKVFDTTDPKICWDGTYKDKEMDTAVFVYYLQAILNNGDPVDQKGNISLVR